uniref:SpaA isopeptide-forming pilin-related protein n=1 Tax=Ruminococcus sp. TaxID=41978 RepID=UPI002588806C
ITGKEELDGAVLTIKDSEGRTVTGTPWTSAKNKKLEVELENGTYTLTETGDKITDAEGNEYEVIDSTLTFKVEDGKVTVVENNTDSNSGEGFYAVDSDTNTITVNDAKKTTKVIINKFDITGKEELDGAVLTIKDSEGRTVTGTPWTSAKGKKLEVELENGTYTLTETGDKITDAEGNEYEVIDSTLTFKVENGKVTVVENNTNSNNGEGFYAVDSDTNTITVNDAKKSNVTITKVVIKKTDITGTEEITGAVLTVKDSDGNTVTGTPWTSGKDGKELELELTNGTYTLTEEAGNNHIVDANGNEYEVIESVLTFKVENGMVTEVINDTEKGSGEGFFEVDSDSNTITVNDAMKSNETTTSVVIKKTDITGTEEITGAVLTVKDSDGNTVTGTPWTSGQDGSELELELENGTYTLTETGDTITDANGNEYEVIDSTLTFKVEDGKVTVVENNTDKDSGEGFFEVDSDSNTITVNDAKKTDDSSKRDRDDDSATVEDSDDSDSSSSSGGPDSSSSKTSTTSSSTSTSTNTSNPNTGARVLINTAEFVAAVGLGFLAIRRKKNDEDDQ